MSAAFPTRRGVTSFIMNTSVHSFHAENNSICHINNANIRTIAAVLEKKIMHVPGPTGKCKLCASIKNRFWKKANPALLVSMFFFYDTERVLESDFYDDCTHN